MFLKSVNPRLNHNSCIIKYFCGVATIILGLGHNSSSVAETTSNIIVDLSMLSDGGTAYRGNRNLASPPSRSPHSRLHVSPRKIIPIKKFFPINISKEGTKEPEKLIVKRANEPVTKPNKNLQSLATATISDEKLAPPALAPTPSPVSKVTRAIVPPPPRVNQPAVSAPKLLKSPPTAPKAAKIVPVSKTSGSKADASNIEELKPGLALRIPFEKMETRIPRGEKSKLVTLADAVRDKKDFRLQLLAYAGGQDLSSSKTRRMSLSRALAVRSYLIVNGVRSTQIDVRALGSKTNEEPMNRVDLNLAKR